MSGGSPLSARAASASRGASARPLRVAPAMNRGARGQEKNQKGRWRGLDEDISDDQMDIQRGRDMVDSKFQGGFGLGGTHVSTLPIPSRAPHDHPDRGKGRARASPAPACTAHKLRVLVRPGGFRGDYYIPRWRAPAELH